MVLFNLVNIALIYLNQVISKTKFSICATDQYEKMVGLTRVTPS